MNVLSWEKAKDYELIEKMIDDYNPEIRSKALEVLNNVPYSLEKDEIVNKVKKRLSDSPLYVRRQAFGVCKNNNLKITNEEKEHIIKEVLEREGDKYIQEFQESLKEIVYL